MTLAAGGERPDRGVQVRKDVVWKEGQASMDGQHLRFSGRLGEYELDIPLLGNYQMENATTAVAALEVLREQGHAIPSPAILEGFAKVFWPCRMEVLSRSPLLVAGGAHNV